MAILGLNWGDAPDTVLKQVALLPQDRADDKLVFPLDTLAGALAQRDAFCPSLLVELAEETEGQLHLAFVSGGLAGGEVRFRFPFEAIGKSADGLSDQSMAAYARFELQKLLLEFTARYGPPVHTGEHTMRWGHAYPVGVALFRSSEADTVMVMLGHDGGGVVGMLRYLPPVTSQNGF